MRRPLALMAIAGLLSLNHGRIARADIPTASAFTGNLALTSDYIFRGLAQAWGRPAIQGGADYTNPNGFAAGVWGSSISERSYPGGALELDLHASYGQPIDADWSWRAGIYGYLYPGANLDQAGLSSRTFNTGEVNAALSYRQVTLKYNRALTDYFAADTEQGYRGTSRGSDVLQLDASFALADAWNLAAHAGHTRYSTQLAVALPNGARDPGYSDFGATLKYQWASQWSVSGGITHATNANFYRRSSSFLRASDTRNVGGTRGFVTLQGTF